MIQNRRKNNLVGYGFILPSLILLIAFIIIPIFMSIILSFMKYDGFSSPSWVGFKNYAKMFTNEDFWVSLKNSLMYVLITVPIQTVVALAIAALLAEKFQNPFGETVRGVMFIPVLCSTSIGATLFFYIFSSDAEGFANMILSLFNISKQNWLGQKSTALLIVCLVAIWKNVGYYMIIFYAGIMDVPKALHEAAEVDGATPLQRFMYITIPGIKPILYLVVTLGTIWAFQAFDAAYVLTGGGPGTATLTPVLIVYNQAFMVRKMGYACAVACILAIIIFIVTIVQRKLFNEKAGE